MKIWAYLAVLVVLIFNVTTYGFTAESPIINASAAILFNVSTEEVLYAKNPDTVMMPASTTKIMTAIIAIENGELDRKVKISHRAAAVRGSSMHLRPGEQQTLRDLLYGLLLSSGNDAAVAIAESIAGSEKKFAEMMNAKARELGMQNTCFRNASGLPAAGHYTTAYDLALLADYAIKNPIFTLIVQTKSTSVPSYRANRLRALVNHNKLLWQYPYTIGIKTGYTRSAGKCLAASAAQNGAILISVVLKSPTIYDDSIHLFDYGFQCMNGTN